MSQSLRDNILALDMFNPCWENGYRVSGMILNSKKLRQYSPAEILAELEKMESEGLVNRMKDESLETVWQSTEAGQTAKEKWLQEHGQRTTVLRQHANSNLSDLVLALLACSRIDHENYRTLRTTKRSMQIYFFNRSMSEIESSITELTKHNYINQKYWLSVLRFSITADGIQHYENYVRNRLGFAQGQCLLDPANADNNLNELRQMDARVEANPNSKQLSRPIDNLDKSKRELKKNYTGVKGTKVFWAAIFTLLPICVALKVPSLHLKLSIASVIYGIYHALGIYIWMDVRQALTDDDPGASAWRFLGKLACIHGIISWLVVILVFATLVARGSIGFYGEHRAKLPTMVYEVLGVHPSEAEPTTPPI